MVTSDEKYQKEYWEEWNRMVEGASIDLKGTCPLLCDETILFVNRYIKSLERKEAINATTH